MSIRQATISTLAAALLAISANAAAADQPGAAVRIQNEATVIACGERAQLAQLLESRYGERFSGATYEAEQGKLELFVAHTGSWTMLLTFPTGRSCPVATGADAERDFNRKDLVGTPT
ncbi:MAG: hypothetical protein AAGM38_07555 [Pseudomonadota bacterium]